VAALGIGGEWAVGASLLSETWPKKWRPWIAAVLQTGVNVGILAAGLANFCLATYQPRVLFLVGILPALLVFWIRKAVPEPQEWLLAKAQKVREAKIRDLFDRNIRAVTLGVTLVCSLSLTAHWAFMFWHQQHLRNLPEVLAMSPAERNRLATLVMYLVIGSSIAGNFFAGWAARRTGYKPTIAGMFLVYCVAMAVTFAIPRDYHSLLVWYPIIGFCQGSFALFTMYLPPLFPTLVRTTGAGFCYNIGRIAAAGGTVFFGLFSGNHGDHRHVLFYAGLLFLPAAAACFYLPSLKDVRRVSS
jgi:MFS family permease